MLELRNPCIITGSTVDDFLFRESGEIVQQFPLWYRSWDCPDRHSIMRTRSYEAWIRTRSWYILEFRWLSNKIDSAKKLTK